MYPLRGEVSESLPHLQGYAASEHTFLIIYSSPLRGEVSESLPRFQTYPGKCFFYILFTTPFMQYSLQVPVKIAIITLKKS